MIDRVLHIGHRFSDQYDKALLQRAAEVYISKGNAAVVPHLMQTENLAAADAQTLAQKINREMLNLNRQVLLSYSVALAVFLFIVFFSIRAEGYVFAGLFLLPALRIIYSMLKFVKRNKLR